MDSLFREYPIPPIFLHQQRTEGLFGGASEQHEIIDGQQRIRALHEFTKGDFPLLIAKDPKLRLPKNLREYPAPWGGRRFAELDSGLQTKLNESLLDVFLVTAVGHQDEIRDLFIRLQSGTALTRQQIRDAWPGAVGPVVEEFAGKLNKRPTFSIFQAVDGRGTRDDEDDPRDQFVQHRQTCAQLMRILLARMVDPLHFPSVEAADVDAFYHENTDIPRDSESLKEVDRIFRSTQRVTDYLATRTTGRKKLPKLSVFVLAFFFQDVSRNQYFKLTDASVERLGDYTAGFVGGGRTRSTSGPAIKVYYESWRDSFPDNVGFTLDPKRLFDDADRAAIRARSIVCSICSREVADVDAEYDHFPLPWAFGGRTTPANGRVIHQKCHPRGKLSSAQYPDIASR